MPEEQPGRADAQSGAAVEEAEAVDAAGESDERVDRAEDEATASAAQSGTPTRRFARGARAAPTAGKTVRTLASRPSGSIDSATYPAK